MKKMKYFFIVGLSLCAIYCYSQKNEKLLTDSCSTKNKYPASCGDLDLNSVKVDTLNSEIFYSFLTEIYQKMTENKDLNETEDRKLLVIMNTLEWSDYFKQSFIKKEFPMLFSVQRFFNDHYKKILKCKYSICIGNGVSPYYKELHVQYLGNPFACDRYYIKN